MSSGNALSIHWSYGFSKDVPECVHSLSQPGRNAMFFVSSHSGVIYDFEHRTQMILQGHCNLIRCCTVSRDKRWIVTADVGIDPILVVWDSVTGAPVKTIFSPHKNGVQSVDISDDALYLVTLSAIDRKLDDSPQEIAIWAWTGDDEAPIMCHNVISNELQHIVRFNETNKTEIVTTGQSSVCFWNWKEFILEGYIAKVSRGDLGNFSGKFTSTIFLRGTGNAVTSTSEGFTIVWESQSNQKNIVSLDKSIKSATKAIRLVDCGINMMSTSENGYFVIACSDGAIRFYDMFLRLEAWFEDLSAGSITSFSLSLQSCPYSEGDAGEPGLKFWVPDFLVGTADAFIVGVESNIFDEVRAEDRRGTLLVQGMAEDVSCVSCHPNRPLLAIACCNGTLQIWDYELKLLMNLREFNSKVSSQRPGTSSGRGMDPSRNILRPQCISFEPSGAFLAVGFTSGNIKFLNVESFDDIASFAPTFDPIVFLKFSQSGLYLAGFDSSNHVLVFKKETPGSQSGGNGQPREQIKAGDFVYFGRVLAHRAPITGLEFGMRDGIETLYSVAEDRICVEYDLEGSSVTFGVICRQDSQLLQRIESTARPTAIMWQPQVEGDIEEKFIVANDEFKFKEFNADSKQCRKTTLAPMFGGPINRILPVTHEGLTKFYAYSTASKVIGIGCLPLTGNPSEIMGIVAHPSTITSISVSFDGRFLFSSGGPDLSVNMWSIDPTYWTERKASNKEDPMAPFLNLLEGGGKGGEMHNDIIDYFYYCQLRAQGEDSMEPRSFKGLIPLEEIPSLVRAVGFYPTEEEVANMVNEVRYKTFMNTGELQNEVDVDEFIRLFLNHRPALPLSNTQIAAAFQTLQKHSGVNMLTDGSNVSLKWGDIKKLLMSEGETISPTDIDAYLSALMGPDGASQLDDLKEMSASAFADQVLGFQDYQ